MVITSLAPSIVASKGISLPLALVSLRVIRASTLLSVRSESSRLRTASSKVRMMLLPTGTSVAPSEGLKVTVGAIVSTYSVVKFSVEGLTMP